MKTPLPRAKNLAILDGIRKGLNDEQMAKMHDIPTRQVEALRRHLYLSEHIPAELLNYIEECNQHSREPREPDPMSRYMEALLNEGQVTVSGRRPDNSGPHSTWKTYRTWREVVKKANKEGLKISRTFIQADNPPPEVPHGCWESCLYELEPSGEAA